MKPVGQETRGTAGRVLVVFDEVLGRYAVDRLRHAVAVAAVDNVRHGDCPWR